MRLILAPRPLYLSLTQQLGTEATSTLSTFRLMMTMMMIRHRKLRGCAVRHVDVLIQLLQNTVSPLITRESVIFPHGIWQISFSYFDTWLSWK
jgi:hypothetical protein